LSFVWDLFVASFTTPLAAIPVPNARSTELESRVVLEHLFEVFPIDPTSALDRVQIDDHFLGRILAQQEIHRVLELRVVHSLREILDDSLYYEKMTLFDEELKKLTDPVWKSKYLNEG